ncbi:hypothetical protein [Microbacterium sp. No. 7]|uniref:hypothetical protein n=1 Tax=Microbacterium sp. No. 7 TaxID=1714373 RepID=UPI0006D24AF7|nr:hypothetical protein [Microbacterium sp. No. 7]ALJ19525.1 hypothetical protein AOA12_06225 [Microbacterium sp. No. 7]
MNEYYRQGALSVRRVNGFPGGFAVYFDHGAEQRTEATIVPARTPNAKHPDYVGQEQPYGGNFRTKTGARQYMQAVAESGILPADRPATTAEIRALRDWIESENAR